MHVQFTHNFIIVTDATVNCISEEYE